MALPSKNVYRCSKSHRPRFHGMALIKERYRELLILHTTNPWSNENSRRGPTRGLFELIFSYTYSWINGLCFGYFQIFPKRSPFDQKLRYPLLPTHPDFLTIRYNIRKVKHVNFFIIRTIL